MDEEIIIRIIYIILAIVVLYPIFTSKKKHSEKKTVTPTSESSSQEIFEPVEQLETKKGIPIESNKIEVLEEIVNDEIFEDETIVDRRIIKKHIDFDQNTSVDDKKQLVITTEDLKKAVILSDIVQPKYF